MISLRLRGKQRAAWPPRCWYSRAIHQPQSRNDIGAGMLQLVPACPDNKSYLLPEVSKRSSPCTRTIWSKKGTRFEATYIETSPSCPCSYLQTFLVVYVPEKIFTDQCLVDATFNFIYGDKASSGILQEDKKNPSVVSRVHKFTKIL